MLVLTLDQTVSGFPTSVDVYTLKPKINLKNDVVSMHVHSGTTIYSFDGVHHIPPKMSQISLRETPSAKIYTFEINLLRLSLII